MSEMDISDKALSGFKSVVMGLKKNKPRNCVDCLRYYPQENMKKYLRFKNGERQEIILCKDCQFTQYPAQEDSPAPIISAALAQEEGE